ncbi:MAG: cupin domain-containing protein [Flavobacteriaceae bacterium]|nr:cupin domain-containing protein [Flavobacteriaceae bacterium]
MNHTVINIPKSLAYSDKRQIKPIFKNDNCTILQLVFKKGQGLPEHTTPIDALLQVIEGECELTMNGNTYILKTNDAIVLPKGEIHEVWAKTMDVRMLLTR